MEERCRFPACTGQLIITESAGARPQGQCDTCERLYIGRRRVLASATGHSHDVKWVDVADGGWAWVSVLDSYLMDLLADTEDESFLL